MHTHLTCEPAPCQTSLILITQELFIFSSHSPAILNKRISEKLEQQCRTAFSAGTTPRCESKRSSTAETPREQSPPPSWHQELLGSQLSWGGKHHEVTGWQCPAVPPHLTAEPCSIPQPGHGASQQNKPHQAQLDY